jgi:hypothetical protein
VSTSREQDLSSGENRSRNTTNDDEDKDAGSSSGRSGGSRSSGY